jgi:hypothetical protein
MSNIDDLKKEILKGMALLKVPEDELKRREEEKKKRLLELKKLQDLVNYHALKDAASVRAD